MAVSMALDSRDEQVCLLPATRELDAYPATCARRARFLRGDRCAPGGGRVGRAVAALALHALARTPAQRETLRARVSAAPDVAARRGAARGARRLVRGESARAGALPPAAAPRRRRGGGAAPRRPRRRGAPAPCRRASSTPRSSPSSRRSGGPRRGDRARRPLVRRAPRARRRGPRAPAPPRAPAQLRGRAAARAGACAAPRRRRAAAAAAARRPAGARARAPAAAAPPTAAPAARGGIARALAPGRARARAAYRPLWACIGDIDEHARVSRPRSARRRARKTRRPPGRASCLRRAPRRRPSASATLTAAAPATPTAAAAAAPPRPRARRPRPRPTRPADAGPAPRCAVARASTHRILERVALARPRVPTCSRSRPRGRARAAESARFLGAARSGRAATRGVRRGRGRVTSPLARRRTPRENLEARRRDALPAAGAVARDRAPADLLAVEVRDLRRVPARRGGGDAGSDGTAVGGGWRIPCPAACLRNAKFSRGVPAARASSISWLARCRRAVSFDTIFGNCRTAPGGPPRSRQSAARTVRWGVAGAGLRQRQPTLPTSAVGAKAIRRPGGPGGGARALGNSEGTVARFFPHAALRVRIERAVA